MSWKEYIRKKILGYALAMEECWTSIAHRGIELEIGRELTPDDVDVMLKKIRDSATIFVCSSCLLVTTIRNLEICCACDKHVCSLCMKIMDMRDVPELDQNVVALTAACPDCYIKPRPFAIKTLHLSLEGDHEIGK
jgi:hypothetical protein